MVKLILKILILVRHKLLSINMMLLSILMQVLIFNLQIMNLISESILHTHLSIKRRHAVHTMKGMCEKSANFFFSCKSVMPERDVGKAFRISTLIHTDGNGVEKCVVKYMNLQEQVLKKLLSSIYTSG